MKSSLQLKVGQQLTMTPQLQQAIRLLQLSSVELQQEIQELLYSNPMLELADGDSGDLEAESDRDSLDSPGEDSREGDEQPLDSGDAIDNERSLEAAERRGSGDTSFSTESFGQVDEPTLADHLLWQLNLSTLSATDMQIGEAIIDAVEPSGFLSIPLHEILQALPPELDVSEAELIAVMHRIQRFDPPVVAARDLRECLLVQLDMLPRETPHLADARLIVDQYLSLVGSTDLPVLARRCRFDVDRTAAAVDLIRSLNPRPGYGVSRDTPDYIVPDVIVTRSSEQWRVALNPDNLPALSIADCYVDLVRDPRSAGDREYLRDKLQEARWFLRSLESRNQTLLRVTTAIVRHQRGFFEHGPVAMQPLILRDLAEELELHESTISRATNQKYLLCPRGVFELKYFFSSQVATNDGGEFSSTAIKALIQELIDAENPRKPLSDGKLTEALNERGILVARRTVAKYREMLSIPSSGNRRRMS